MINILINEKKGRDKTLLKSRARLADTRNLNNLFYFKAERKEKKRKEKKRKEKKRKEKKRKGKDFFCFEIHLKKSVQSVERSAAILFKVAVCIQSG